MIRPPQTLGHWLYRRRLARGNVFDESNFFNRGCSFSATVWGRHSGCNADCVINSCHIGRYCEFAWNVVIGPRVHLFTNFTNRDFIYRQGEQVFDLTRDGMFDGRFNRIGHDVWIGCQVVVLQGVEIGNGAVISAGSVVTKSVPASSIVGGNPARVIRRRFPEDVAGRLEESRWFEKEPAEILAMRDELQKLTGFDLEDFRRRYWQTPRPLMNIS